MQLIADSQIAALAARVATQTALRPVVVSTSIPAAPTTALNIAGHLTEASAYQLLTRTAANWISQTINVRIATDPQVPMMLIAKGKTTVPLRALTNALQEVLHKPAHRDLLEQALSRLSGQLPVVVERIAAQQQQHPEHPIAGWLSPQNESRAPRRRKPRNGKARADDESQAEHAEASDDRTSQAQEETSLATLVDLAQWLNQASYPEEYGDGFKTTARREPAQISEHA